MTRSKLRITILGLNYAPEPTGNAPYTTSLAEGLASAGHSVQVITGYPHYPEWKPKAGYSGWASKEVVNGVNVTRLRHYIPRRPTAFKRMHMEMSFGLRLIMTGWANPDVVLVVSPALFSSGLAIFRARVSLGRQPAIAIWVQDIYSRGVVETGMGGSRLAGIMGKVESLILRSADGIVAIHERFRQYMVASLGVPLASTRVIRNWTHLPPAPTSGHAEIRAQMGWSDDDIIVLHAGNMGQKQGLDCVLEAAALAAERQSSVRFVLMGDGNQRERLEAATPKGARLDFLDPLPEAEFQGALAAANVLLVTEVPGVKDMAVPSKLTSYFNAGLPVIAATDEQSVTASEIEASGGGIRIDAGNPSRLLETAEALGRDAALAASLGAHALRFRHDTLSEAAAVGHYDDFITSLATSRRR